MFIFRKRIVPLLLSLIFLTGCAQSTAENKVEYNETAVYIDPVEMEEIYIEDEAVALAASPAAISTALMPEASGVSVKKSDDAIIDYSNISDGYVMVNYTGAADKRLKVQVTGPTTTYTYDLPAGKWTTFPLSDGNGTYKTTVLQNTKESKYAAVISESFSVSLSDEFAPFLRPNQYVDYANAKQTIQKAAELAGGVSEPLDKVAKIYDYVVANLTYDKDKAASVQSGYLPVLDSVLASKKGICFDYASLMTGMLRSQGVPCKLVVGYAGTAYHAWISVWTKETGWIDGVIYFNGTTWQRMDPTFASSGGESEAIMQYIGDGSNYTQKYLY
ncbi:hypothetical protein IMSAG049_01686 [Clostridiales bacterium]|nr:hypothetical protein IMSAG049_01686 [Clostridiales bacterium]